MLEIDRITKSFVPGRIAVDQISFSVKRGEIFGLLGHNGAGKSTLLGCTLGMVYPDSGEVRIDGISVQKNREAALKKVGAIFEAPAFYDYLSGWQNLKILASLSGFTDEARLRQTVEQVGLKDRINHLVGMYSHGMLQRLALAQSLVPEPELLLLDEPTDGLDPEGIREFREFVLRLRAERGMTILFNSHLLSEVEVMCDRVAIIKGGQLLYVGDGKDLRRAEDRYAFEVDDREKFRTALASLGLSTGDPATDWVDVPLGYDIAEVVAAAVRGGVRVRGVRSVQESLEDLYLKVRGEARVG